jgi:hypothetical protein
MDDDKAVGQSFTSISISSNSSGRGSPALNERATRSFIVWGRVTSDIDLSLPAWVGQKLRTFIMRQRPSQLNVM